MADSLPDSRGGGEAGTAGVAGAKTDGLPLGDSTQQQKEGEAALDEGGGGAHSSDAQQNECGAISEHPAGGASVVPAGKGREDTDTQQNECGGVSLCPAGTGSVVQVGKEKADTGSLVVVQNNTENTSSESSMTESELTQGSSQTNKALAMKGGEDAGNLVALQNNSEEGGCVASNAHGELIQGSDESKLGKVSVSQPKDPPDRNGSPASQEAVDAGPGAPPASVAAVSVSTKPPESLSTPSEQAASEPPAPPPGTEGFAVPAALGDGLAVQSAVKDSSQALSLHTEQPPSLGLNPLSSASSDGVQQAAAQASPRASSPLSAPGAAGAEGGDLDSDVAVGVLRSIVPEEVEATLAATSVSQCENEESEPQLPDSEKNRTQSEAMDTQESVTGQSDTPMELSENWNDRNFTCEADTETLPLIVGAHSLSQKENAEEPGQAAESAAAAEGDSSGKKVVPLLDSEPLRPVTIGSSLQPLEELQEATAEEEAPSFTADLAIIDSSADEADSIGGLVINNVIGAADGVVDFQPDEVEAEKELMDISSSAPQISDTTEEDGPSVKRRRLENGPSDSEDKIDSEKMVLLKLIPVKNGHGVWDAQKLLEVLAAKGTILLQVHASKESLELCEADKTDTEKTVDFSAIMAATKDDDHDHDLPCGNGSGEPEGDDPLAIISSTNETGTHPSFGRSFPPPQSRSTALQPAMPPRPTFKHLQTPQHYYMKNEVLGLPPPLEFEEPQGASPDMSGADTHSVAPPGPQATASILLPLPPRVASEKTRRVQVCGECGRVFHNPVSYNMHVKTHQPWIACIRCPFKTKLAQKLEWHALIHKRNPHLKCFTCHRSFSRVESLLVHQKKMHYVYQCKYCGIFWEENESLRRHLQEVYNKDGDLPICWVKKNREAAVPEASQRTEAYGSQAASSLSQTSGRGPQHDDALVNVTAYPLSDISKVFVKQENEVYDVSDSPPPPSSFSGTMESGEVAQQGVQVASTPPGTNVSSSFLPGKTVLTRSPKSQLLHTLRPEVILQTPQSSDDSDDSDLDFASSSRSATFKPAITSRPDLTSAAQDSRGLDVTPSTSLAGSPRPGAPNVTIIKNIDKDGNTIRTLICHKPDPQIFGAPIDLKELPPTSQPEHHSLSFPITWLNKTQKIQQPKVDVAWKPKAPVAKLKLVCHMCKDVFHSSKSLAKHKKLKHKKEYKCPDCGIIMRNNYRLMRHQKMMHKERLRCRYFCGELCGTVEELLSHYRKVHNKYVSKQECPYCQRNFIYEGFLTNHLEKCPQRPTIESPAHVCGKCEGFFSNIEEYNKHALACLTTPEEGDGQAPSTSSPAAGKTHVAVCKEGANEPEEEPKNTDEIDAVDLETSKAGSDKDFPEPNTPKGPISKQLMCKYCPGVSVKMENAIGHILNSHSEMANRMMVAPLKCEMCGLIFKNPTCYCKHVMKHYMKLNKWDAFVPRDILKIVKVKGYCWVCNNHVIKAHIGQRDAVIDEAVFTEELMCKDVKPLRCDECVELFPTRKLFWLHVKEHLAVLPTGEVHYTDMKRDGSSFQCCECKIKCPDREKLYQHITRHFLVDDKEVTQVSKKEEEKTDDKKMDSTEDDVEASRKEQVEDSEIIDLEDSEDDNAGNENDNGKDGENDIDDSENFDAEDENDDEGGSDSISDLGDY